MMNLGAMNPNVAGGPVGGGGGMMTMNNGSPATPANLNLSTEALKLQLNTYIYEYFLKCGHYDIARSLLREEKFELRTRPPVKQSPGRRKDGEVNGIDGDAMDMDMKDDIPDDMPRPSPESGPQGAGFLFDWFSIFSDLYNAHRSGSKMQGNGMTLPAQYLVQHQNLQRLRESQQNQNLGRPGMNVNQFAMRAGLRNGQMQRADAAKSFTPQQLQQLQQQQKQQLMQQQQMQREQGEVDMNGRPATPGEGENGGSPSKRPRLEGQQFNGAMMPNGRPGMPGVAPQGMMIQNSFNPNMNQAQFRQQGGQKMMQPGMPNGMMGMGNAGSPMMQGMNPAQFADGIPMDMYNGRMVGPPMQGGVAGQSGNHALADYQMQLMLLEQQNKKRLMMARAEQDNNHNRDGGPLPVGMQAVGMSPSNSRSGTSPNPTEQLKRNAQLAGLPASPAAGDGMQGRSPAAMGFMNGMQGTEFGTGMFVKENPNMMVPGNPNMRAPTSMDMQAMARQQQNRMAAQFQGGVQPMAQQPPQGQPQPMGTPGQRNDMPPPQAPANNSAQRNQPSSPQSSNAPPTPSQTSKANPKNRKGKDDSTKKKPAKKSSAAAAPTTEGEPPATPTPSTPITPVHPNSFNNSGNKTAATGVSNATQPQASNPAIPPNQPQIPQPDLSQQPAYPEFNPEMAMSLDFSTLDNPDVLENFDFDSFLNTGPDEGFSFDGGIGVGPDFGLDPSGE